MHSSAAVHCSGAMPTEVPALNLAEFIKVNRPFAKF